MQRGVSARTVAPWGASLEKQRPRGSVLSATGRSLLSQPLSRSWAQLLLAKNRAGRPQQARLSSACEFSGPVVSYRRCIISSRVGGRCRFACCKNVMCSTMSLDYNRPCQQLDDNSTVTLLQPQHHFCMLQLRPDPALRCLQQCLFQLHCQSRPHKSKQPDTPCQLPVRLETVVNTEMVTSRLSLSLSIWTAAFLQASRHVLMYVMMVLSIATHTACILYHNTS